MATYDVFQGLCDGLTGVPSLHDHGRLHILHQLRRSALQEAFGALRLGLPVDPHTRAQTELTKGQSKDDEDAFRVTTQEWLNKESSLMIVDKEQKVSD